MKKLSVMFGILAVLLSDTMCAVVAYHYCDLLWGGRYAGYGAPPSAAFLYAMPFAVSIVVSLILAAACKKKAAQS